MIKSRLGNSLWGFILGDCLGVPYEFQSKNYCSSNFKFFKDKGTWGQLAGTWSDDSSLLLCTLDSYLTDFKLDLHKDLLKEVIKGNYSVNRKLFDIGNATLKGISEEKGFDSSNEYGNGGLIRCFLVDLFSDKSTLKDFLKITHSSDEEYLSWVDLYTNIYKLLLLGKKEEAKLFYLSKKADLEVSKYSFKTGTIHSSLRIVLSHYFSGSKMKDLIGEGGDTDTNGALFGLLYYTLEKFPSKYKRKIRNSEFAEEKIKKFIETCNINSLAV